MDRIAVFILARKNSKRIPGKNTKTFCGVPLIIWTLEDAKKTGYPVVVSSDDEKIKTMSDAFYPTFIFIEKKPEYAQDKHDTMNELKYLNSYINADILILLQATSPVRASKRIPVWIEDFKKSGFDCGISASPQKGFFYNQEAVCVNPVDRSGANGKSELYRENGSFYIFKREQLEKNHITEGKLKLYIDKYDIDLDDEREWSREEMLLQGGYYDTRENRAE